MKLEAIPRPAYLDAASPKQALISYHSEQARHNRQQLTEQMIFEVNEEARFRNIIASPEDFWKKVETAKWDESPLAVWRDRMKFHERCVEFLTNG
jgi:hypothetical protein